jgi:hypothetical protein
MVKDSITFPVYRKYEGDRSFFKITSEKEFIEVQVMGPRFFVHNITAKTFPDFQMIVDMINLHNNHWIECTDQEFEHIFTSHLESLEKVK